MRNRLAFIMPLCCPRTLSMGDLHQQHKHTALTIDATACIEAICPHVQACTSTNQAVGIDYATV
jgi:hypothetical protein